MPFPTRVEISNAIRYPQFVKDSFLDGYSVLINRSGKVQEWGGGLSMVYCFEKDNNKWAYKVWHTEIPENRTRYEIITQYLHDHKLSYFTEFKFIDNGLLFIDQQLNTSHYVDALRMEWIDGLNLTEYISFNLKKRQVLEKLASNFLNMIENLHQHNISHGDLQHENIFIDHLGELKLIDYDSICVPDLGGQSDFFRGRQGFQHPSRFMAGFITSTKIDYFSELIIYLTILAVIENPVLWDKYNVQQAEYRLLFSSYDFLDWEHSEIRKDMYLLSKEVQNLMKILDNYLAAHLNLNPFTPSS
jgi:serine/threonine protein kinase